MDVLASQNEVDEALSMPDGVLEDAHTENTENATDAPLGVVRSLWRHLQTSTAALPIVPPMARDVVRFHVDIPFEDGSLVAVLELLADDAGAIKRAPAVIVVHGVAGSSDDAYVMRAARALSRRGFHVLRLNQRGSGLGIGKAKKLYHAGTADDVAIAVRFLSQRDDVASIGVLGFSLGGHVSLNYAADVSALAAIDVPLKLRAIASVSAPADLHATMLQFDRNRTTPWRIYERLMTKSLVEKARALLDRGVAHPFAHELLDTIADIRAFDHHVTCPSHGFVDVADYHARVSAGPRLHTIELPTLVVHASDDPIVPVAPLRRFDRSRAVDVVVLDSGGHVGFVGGISGLWGASTAVARAIAHFERYL